MRSPADAATRWATRGAVACEGHRIAALAAFLSDAASVSAVATNAPVAGPGVPAASGRKGGPALPAGRAAVPALAA